MNVWLKILIYILVLLCIIIIIRWRTKYSKKYIGINNNVTKKIIKQGEKMVSDFFGFFKKSKKREHKSENKCRKIIENIFNSKFPSIRPSFLKSPLTGKNLELDCYNANLGIALEYNGIQHYQYTPVFHKSEKDFYSQVHRDDFKRKKCQDLGIKLIEVPYWIHESEMESFIKNELIKKKCI